MSIDFKELVLEQARALAKDFVTEFKSEVARQLKTTETVVTSPVETSPLVSAILSPKEELPPITGPSWKGFRPEVVKSFLKDRDTTGGLKGLKLQFADKEEEPKIQFPTLINQNFTAESVEKMIASYEEKLKDPSLSTEFRSLLETTQQTLKNCLATDPSLKGYVGWSNIAKMQELERNMHEREAMIKTVYSSDLDEEIQNQAKVLLAMTEAVENNKAKAKASDSNSKIFEILAQTQPIDEREKESGISCAKDLTDDMKRTMTSQAVRNAIGSGVTEEARAKHLAVKEAVGNLKHEADPRLLAHAEELDKAVMNEGLSDILGLYSYPDSKAQEDAQADKAYYAQKFAGEAERILGIKT